MTEKKKRIKRQTGLNKKKKKRKELEGLPEPAVVEKTELSLSVNTAKKKEK